MFSTNLIRKCQKVVIKQHNASSQCITLSKFVAVSLSDAEEIQNSYLKRGTGVCFSFNN